MEFESRRMLITGGTGFVGSHLCPALRRLGADVVAIARHVDSNADSGEVRSVDCLDPSALGALVRDHMPEFVVHLAASRDRGLSLPQIRAGYDANLMATLNLLAACEEVGCQPRFIFLGSCEEYGSCPAPFEEDVRERPTSAYGVSKLAATQLVQAVSSTRGLRAVILRPTIVFGPGQAEDMFLPSLLKSLLANREFPMTAGAQTRDYIFVDDLNDAIIAALSTELAPGTVINVSAGSTVQLKELALLVAASVGPGAEKLIRFGALDYRPNEVMDYSASNRRAAKLLSWAPMIPLQAGIARVVSGMQAPGFR